MSLSPEADAMIAALDFAPTCITTNHDDTDRPEAFWAVYPNACCGDTPWLVCDDCLGFFTRPNGIVRFRGSDHEHTPARTATRKIAAIS